MSIDFRDLKERAWQGLQPSAPFFVHAIASAGTFAACLGATQALGYCCKVSCATPLLGSAFGLAGVGLASCAAGQVSIQCQRHYSGQKIGLLLPRKEDLLVDAALGVLIFKVLGGRFRNIMPSDLFTPGAHARDSVPAAGKQYVGNKAKEELVYYMRRDGCHHCGTRRGEVIGDHMPPNRMVYGSGYKLMESASKQLSALGSTLGRTKAPRKKIVSQKLNSRLSRLLQHAKTIVQDVLDPQSTMPKQRYYPQCKACSNKQSGAVKKQQRTLVMHHLNIKKSLLSGALVGLRHYGTYASPPPPNKSRGKKSQRWEGPSGGHDAFGIGRLMCVPAMLGDDLGGRMERQAKRLVDHARSHQPQQLPTMCMHRGIAW